MQQSGLETTLGSLVADRISRARVFEQFGLDYCCGGNVALGEACQEKGLNPNEVLEALSASDAGIKADDATNWKQATLTDLIDHIEGTHHVYLRSELPRLATLMEKVVTAHSERHPDLTKVAGTLTSLTAELTQHMAKEEQILFPVVRRMESAGEVASDEGSVSQPIDVMEAEHINAGNALTNLREMTNGYQPPDDACATYQALLNGLAELELDLHQHIHKENSILFPRAIALEKKLK